MIENHEANAATNSRLRTSTASPREILIAARRLIEHPEDWTCRGSFFDGRAMCAAGAIAIASREPVTKVACLPAYIELEAAMGGIVSTFNDKHTHAEVLAAFDRAIEQCAVGDRESQPASTEVA